MKIKFNRIDILIMILFILLVYFILTWIAGHSVSNLTIRVSLVSLLAGLFVILIFFTTNFYRGFGEVRIKTIYNFDNIKEDMTLIKRKLKIKG